jgi:hypothetical protein
VAEAATVLADALVLVLQPLTGDVCPRDSGGFSSHTNGLPS